MTLCSIQLARAAGQAPSVSVEVDNVVVVGYGVQNKRDVTTAISSIKASDFADMPTTDFRDAMAAKMPGVQVLQLGGQPDGNVSIRVRGIQSATAGNDPLYVIDGIPCDSRAFANLDGGDIESLEVLNAYEFAQIHKEARDGAYLSEVAGASIDDPYEERPKTYHRVNPLIKAYLHDRSGTLTDTDWQDAIFRSAISTKHSLSVSGRPRSWPAAATSAASTRWLPRRRTATISTSSPRYRPTASCSTCGTPGTTASTVVTTCSTTSRAPGLKTATDTGASASSCGRGGISTSTAPSGSCPSRARSSRPPKPSVCPAARRHVRTEEIPRAGAPRRQVVDLKAESGDGSVKLSWNVSEGWAPTDFLIFYTDDLLQIIMFNTGGKREYTVDKLTIGVQYTFSVQAVYGTLISNAVTVEAEPEANNRKK